MVCDVQHKNTGLVFDRLDGVEYHPGMSEIARLRSRHGLTQQQLAELAGTSQPQIKRLESGERKLTKEWALRLAPHLKTTAEALLFPAPKDSIDRMLENLPKDVADDLHDEFERRVLHTQKLIDDRHKPAR